MSEVLKLGAGNNASYEIVFGLGTSVGIEPFESALEEYPELSIVLNQNDGSAAVAEMIRQLEQPGNLTLRFPYLNQIIVHNP